MIATPNDPILAIENVGKAFGALKVLTDVNLTVNAGEFVGLIGPNGAGKTTLFNVVTGFLTPSHGKISFAGGDITHAKPHQRVRAGIVRTFQKSMVFPDLTVLENLALAIRALEHGYGWWRSAKQIALADAQALDVLGRVGMQSHAYKAVSSLSYGEQRIVDVLVSLAMKPRMLLLDEPTAGLSKAEGDHLIEVIRATGTGTSIILVAHDLDIVFSVCDRVAVLDLGKMIACDTPAAIRAHEGAQAAYLGKNKEVSA
ncbi:ABC transporter ATP-binding protein [Rhizobium leguminosarum]